jgi:hypothetical protein
MFEGLFTAVEMLLSWTRFPLPVTIPTMVPFWVGSVVAMKPEPVIFKLNFVPEAAVGRLAGLIADKVAVGDTTLMVMGTTVVVGGVPQVMLTAPLSVPPGAAEGKTCGLRFKVTTVPKLYAKP